MHTLFFKTRLFRGYLLVLGLLWSSSIFSQETAAPHPIRFRGSVSVTNNGFSFIPSFTLGKPAAIATFAVSGPKRLSFEPEFRYSLEGKPWSFIFIWRYKLIKTNKFQFTVGTHLPTVSFRTPTVIKNNDTLNIVQAQSFFPVGELLPNYQITPNISLSAYYLYGHGTERDMAQNLHFASLRVNFTHLPLGKKLYLRLMPQLFYLKIDQSDGTYVAGNAVLTWQGFPLSIGSTVNKAIQTDIVGKGFDWNVSLIYSFDQRLQKS